MKAIVFTKYGSPDVLQLREVEKPVPNHRQVLINVHATAVTASDCIMRGFKVPIALWLPMGLVIGFTKPRQPILGMVFAGEVESAGRDVRSFRKGDEVFGFDRFGFGAYAEYKCLPEKGLMALKPSNLTYEEAAAIPYGGLLALHFLRTANIHSGQRALIYGASGAVGTSAVQLAKHFGAAVTGVCSTQNLEFVKSLGANAVIDYTAEKSTDIGGSYDLVFDAVGKSKSSQLKLQSRTALAAGGRSISVDDGSPKMQLADLVLLRELVEVGHLRPVIDRRYPLEQMAEAHRFVERGHKKGNVVITVGHSANT